MKSPIKKVKVNVDAVDPEMRFLVKDEMTRQEIGQLGVAVMHWKVEKLKNRLSIWKHTVRERLERYFRTRLNSKR